MNSNPAQQSQVFIVAAICASLVISIVLNFLLCLLPPIFSSNNFLQAGGILASSHNHAAPAERELDEHIYDKEMDDGNAYLLEQVLYLIFLLKHLTLFDWKL